MKTNSEIKVAYCSMWFHIPGDHKVHFSQIHSTPQVVEISMVLSIYRLIAGYSHYRKVIELNTSISILTGKYSSFHSLKFIGDVCLRALCMDKAQL